MWAIVRDTRKNLGQTTVKSIKRWISEEEGRYYGLRESPDSMSFPQANPFLEFLFIGCDSLADMNRFQGAEWAGAWLEEPAPVAELSTGVSEDVYALCTTSLRQAGIIGHRLQITMNPPDENHWTVQKIRPMEETEWIIIPKGSNPHLPPGYREMNLKALMAAGRIDLVRRLVEGEIGAVQMGPKVTPEFGGAHIIDAWPIAHPGKSIDILWDFGRTPVAVVTQYNKFWNVYATFAAGNEALDQHVEQIVRPFLREHFRGFHFRHICDHTVDMRRGEANNATCGDILSVAIPGSVIPGPMSWGERRDAARSVLRRMVEEGQPLVRIYRPLNKALIDSLSGGWHYYKDSMGKVYEKGAVKDERSHPGDAFSVGAAELFPISRTLSIEELEQDAKPTGKSDPLDMFSDPLEQRHRELSEVGLPIGDGE